MVCVAVADVAADSGGGADDPPGNALNPHTPLPGGQIDELGYSLFSTVAFSPSGILYPLVYQYPWLHPEPAPGPEDETTPEWHFGGLIEAGFLADFGTTDAAGFREFADFDDGPLVNRFALVAEHARRGDRVELIGAGPGRDDQYFALDYRRPGTFEINAWYNRIPHVFSTNARVLWDGAGSGTLTLPDGLEPGASTPQQVRAALLSRGESTLKLDRKRVGLAGTLLALDNLNAFFKASSEWRNGERPFGGTFDYPTLGQVTETVEPIDYLTHEVDAGMHYTGRRIQANLTWSSSFFINDTDALVWENPGLSILQPDFVAPRGRTALAPDNRFHQIQADLAIALPVMHGRWTSTLAYNCKTQDDDLLPPTISTGVGNNAGVPVNFDLWNTPGALSRTSADAKIRTALLQSEVSLLPTRRLRTSLKLRALDEDNDTHFETFNPQTGEYGRIPLDGGLLFDDGIFQPGRPGELLRIANVPYETDELEITADADYRLTRSTRLAATLSYDRTDHAHRQRSTTRDKRVRLQLSDRAGPWASLRLAVETARRDGDDYQIDPQAPFLSASLAGFVPRFEDGTRPRELADLREFDLASRDQRVADGQLRFNPGTLSDLAISGRWVHDDFDAGFGLREQTRLSTNAEWNYQFHERGNAYVYYSFQAHDREAANINDAGPSAPDPFAGGEVFPLANLWRQNLDETNHGAGLGLTRQWKQFLFEIDYTFGYARAEQALRFNSGGALSSGIGLDAAGDSLPDSVFERHLLRASLRFPINRHVGAQLLYRLESEDIEDPNFAGLDDPLVDNQLFLLAVPEDFTAHLVGVLLEFRFGGTDE
ncbi:MAG: MtrB/PioB family outer membrane beta-barrel protein [Wenzhouxiangellaceae bacterium]